MRKHSKTGENRKNRGKDRKTEEKIGKQRKT